MAEAAEVVIVGAGQAGLWCAKTLRQHEFPGRILLLGEELHPPYDRPPLSKKVLVGDALPETTWYLTLAQLAGLGIDFRPATVAASIDRAGGSVATAAGERIAYDHLVLTTGARVRLLQVPGAAEASVHYLRGIDDCLLLQKALSPGRRVIVCGGGLIGLEVAAAAIKRGAHATVVEAADRVLARIVGPEVSAHFENLHRRHGVRLLTGRMPSAVAATPSGYSVTFEDGSVAEGDLIVAGIGVLPNDTLAAAAGLRTGNGVWVDEFGRTEDPRIWAAGDVTNHVNPLFGRRLRLETWQNAKNQGAAVARNICGLATPYAEQPWGWSDQFGVNLQMLGMVDCARAGVLRGSMEDGAFSIFHLELGRVTGMIAVNAVRDVSAARRLIAKNIAVTPELLSDTSVSLKALAES